MPHVTADLDIELRFAGEFKIEINADVDCDRVPSDISLWYSNYLTKRCRRISDRNPKVDAYIRERFDEEINEAICCSLDTLDDDDSAYDAWKESF